MRHKVRLSVLLILAILLFSSSCQKTIYSKKPTTKADCLLEIIYKRGQTYYATEPTKESLKMYIFTSAGQPIFDQDGQQISSASLKTGQIINVSYDGYIIETYPLQFSGISGIKIEGSRSNNVDFLITQISGMFPSTKPEDKKHWDILFSGEPFLSESEKRAIEYILKENWIGAQITVTPEFSDEEKGTIQVDFSNVGTQSMDVQITVDEKIEGVAPSVRKIHVVLSDGTWTIVK
ncbi:MAG: hypothetical protein IKG93_00520 [Clostridiales bacterium]|nr:hypothetical protein [Clostridiales bacterium]